MGTRGPFLAPIVKQATLPGFENYATKYQVNKTDYSVLADVHKEILDKKSSNKISTTEDLYGITSTQLHNIIGREQHKTMCDVRINILKDRLDAIVAQSSVDPRIARISNAIEFWKQLRDEEK